MYNKGKKRILAIFMIVLIIILGFVRDYLFKGINYFIKQLYFNLDRDYDTTLFRLLKNLDLDELLKLKWALTFLFMFLNLGLSYLTLKNLFIKSKNPINLLFAGYVMFFILSGLFYFFGKIGGFPELGYTLSRRFMGGLQSPVPLMFVGAVHLMFSDKNKENTE